MDKNHKFKRGVLWSLYLALSYTLFFIAPIILRARLRRGKEDPARMAEKLGIASAPASCQNFGGTVNLASCSWRG